MHKHYERQLDKSTVIRPVLLEPGYFVKINSAAAGLGSDYTLRTKGQH